jgi:hypothetical protein
VSNNRAGDARVSEDDLKISNTDVWRAKYLFLSFRISSYQTRISVNPRPGVDARCSFQSVFSKLIDSSFSRPRPLTRLQNRHGPFLRLILRFLSFFDGAWLSKFDKFRRTSTPDYVTSTSRSYLQRRTCYFARLA